MLIKQISVFIENKTGRLHELTEVLKQNNIDLVALCIADTTDFGILRCIVKDPHGTVHLLRESGFTASISKVIGVRVNDKPGGLTDVLGVLEQKDISIDYLYSFVRTKGDSALILFKVADVQAAEALLKEHSFDVLEEKDLEELVK